jgi:hypothetical protein
MYHTLSGFKYCCYSLNLVVNHWNMYDKILYHSTVYILYVQIFGFIVEIYLSARN